jgi:hypothetical protein
VDCWIFSVITSSSPAWLWLGGVPLVSACRLSFPKIPSGPDDSCHRVKSLGEERLPGSWVYENVAEFNGRRPQIAPWSRGSPPRNDRAEASSSRNAAIPVVEPADAAL